MVRKEEGGRGEEGGGGGGRGRRRKTVAFTTWIQSLPHISATPLPHYH